MNVSDKLDRLQNIVESEFATGKKTIVVDIETLYELFETNGILRLALLPFAAAAARPGRLVECMTDQPLDDNAVAGLGVRVSAWREAIRLTSADGVGREWKPGYFPPKE